MATGVRPKSTRAARKSAPTPKAARSRASGSGLARPRAGQKLPRNQSLTKRAYSQIEEAIVTLQIPPGSTVSELALSEMTGIGRTPIREAIQRVERSTGCWTTSRHSPARRLRSFDPVTSQSR